MSNPAEIRHVNESIALAQFDLLVAALKAQYGPRRVAAVLLDAPDYSLPGLTAALRLAFPAPKK